MSTEQRKLSDSISIALSDRQRRRGICSFLGFMVAVCLIITCGLSVLLAFPIPKEAIDGRLVKFLLTEILLFFPHTFVLALTASSLKVNTKQNSVLMILIVLLDVAMLAMATVMAIFVSSLTR